jgi:predicted dehydrogenase
VLRAAVVGLGWWGQTLLRLLRGSAAIAPAVLADVDRALARRLADETGARAVLDYEDALRDPGVDAVILCTPHSTHCEQVVRAAQAGKHVFCEKPLALSRADALRAVSACEAHRVVLGIGHERRFEPPILELRRLYESGALGKALQVEANFSQDKFLSLPADNWRLSAAEAPAGPLTATGIHLLDLSVSLLGPADHVYATVRQLGSPLANGDALAILAQFRNGAAALVSAMLATPFEGRFALYGSQGWAEVRDRSHPEAPAGWTLTVCERGKPRAVREFPPAPAVLANLEAFARAAAGGEPYPVPRAQMIDNVALLEATVASARSGQIARVAG